mmetsp:Transcript_30155/g.37187  ORF Transcript_30155/g.37187 Transcript_30155/m.37187 type:complete len:151 (+) Transcript_30155:310-762(+)
MMDNVQPQDIEVDLKFGQALSKFSTDEMESWDMSVSCKVVVDNEMSFPLAANVTQLEVHVFHNNENDKDSVIAGVEIGQANDSWHPAERFLEKYARRFRDGSSIYIDPSLGLLWRHIWPLSRADISGVEFMCRVTNDRLYTSKEHGPFQV